MPLQVGTWNYYDGNPDAGLNPRLNIQNAAPPPGAPPAYIYYTGDLDGIPMNLQLDNNTGDVVMVVTPVVGPGPIHPLTVVGTGRIVTGTNFGTQTVMAGQFGPSVLEIVRAQMRGLPPPPLKPWAATT